MDRLGPNAFPLSLYRYVANIHLEGTMSPIDLSDEMKFYANLRFGTNLSMAIETSISDMRNQIEEIKTIGRIREIRGLYAAEHKGLAIAYGDMLLDCEYSQYGALLKAITNEMTRI